MIIHALHFGTLALVVMMNWYVLYGWLFIGIRLLCGYLR